MKLKKIMLVTFVLLAILTIGAASAADDTISEDLAVSDDVDEVSVDASVDCDVISEDSGVEVAASSEDDVISDGNSTIGDENTQVELQNKIENTAEGDTLVLDKDYAFTGPVSEGNPIGISINKAITIDGKGHTIDANGYCTIFAIDAPDITLLSIAFKNGCVNGDFSGAAIGGGNSGLTVINCTFENNEAIDCPNAGAIGMLGDNITIMNSVFMSNSGFENGGAIEIRGNNARISDCHFRSNMVLGSNTKGGAIFILGESGTISNCLFENHTADYGGDICIMGPQDNFVIEDCSSDGGEVNIDFYEGDDSGVELWIDTENVFTIAGPDDLAQIFATVTVDDGVQGNVLFVGDDGLYNKQLNEFDTEDIEDNVYKIALGYDGQFIFETLSSFDIFEFSFLMEGSDEPFITKKYMILLENDTVRFIDYDNIVKLWINTEDVFSTDDLSQIFATVTAADGVQGNVLFVGDDGLYNKQLNEFDTEDIEDNVYKIALGYDGQFIFENLENGDLFEFLFLLEGSDEAFVSKQYMIFFDDDTVRFEEYNPINQIWYNEEEIDINGDEEYNSSTRVFAITNLEGTTYGTFVMENEEGTVKIFEIACGSADDKHYDYYAYLSDLDLTKLNDEDVVRVAFCGAESDEDVYEKWFTVQLTDTFIKFNEIDDEEEDENSFINKDRIITNTDDEDYENVVIASYDDTTIRQIVICLKDFETFLLNRSITQEDFNEGIYNVHLEDLNFTNIEDRDIIRFACFDEEGNPIEDYTMDCSIKVENDYIQFYSFDDEIFLEFYSFYGNLTRGDLNNEDLMGWHPNGNFIEILTPNELNDLIINVYGGEFTQTYTSEDMEVEYEYHSLGYIYMIKLDDEIKSTLPENQVITFNYLCNDANVTQKRIRQGDYVYKLITPDDVLNLFLINITDDELQDSEDVAVTINATGNANRQSIYIELSGGYFCVYVNDVKVENLGRLVRIDNETELELCRLCGHDESWPNLGITLADLGITEPGYYNIKVTHIPEDGEGEFVLHQETEVITKNITFASSSGLIDPMINVTVDSVVYGNDLVINIRGPDGPISITVDGNTYTIVIVYGVGILTINGLNAGTYIVTVDYAGDDEYYAYTNQTVVEVLKANSSFTMNETVFDYAEEITFNYTLIGADDFEGIAIGDYPEGEEPYATWDDVGYLHGFTAGNFTVQFTTVPDENHNAFVVNYTIIINRIPSSVNVEDVVAYEGETIAVPTIVDGATGVNASVIDYPDANITYTSDGVVISGLAAGEYTLKVVTIPDENHYAAETNMTITVKQKLVLPLTVTVADITYGEDLVAIISSDEDVEVYVWLDDDEGSMLMVQIENGTAEWTLNDVYPGVHVVTVRFPGNEDYDETVVNTTVSVSKLEVPLVINADDVFVGAPFTVEFIVEEGATGNVSVTINEMVMQLVIDENSGSAIFALQDGMPEGNYTIYAVYSGDERFASSSATAIVTVKQKPNLPLTITADDITYGEDLFVLISADADVGVGVKLDDVAESVIYFVQIVNGSGNCTFSNVNSGLHTVTVSFPGDDDYAETVVSKNVTVNRAASTIEISNYTIDYGKAASIPIVKTGATGVNATFVENPNIDVTISDNAISFKGDVNAGNYTLKVVTVPDENHYSVEATATVTVNKIDSTLNVSDVVFDFGKSGVSYISYSGILYVNASVVGHPEAIVDKQDTEIVISNLDAGTYTLSVITVPDVNHNSVEVNVSVTVNKVDPSFALDADVFDYADEFNVTFSVDGAKDISFEIVDNPEVDFVCDIENNVMTIFDLNAGTHTLNVLIEPDDNHNDVELNVTIVVNKVDSSITLEKTVFDYAEEIEVNYTLVGADDFDGEALDCPGASVSWEEVVYLRDFTAGTHVVQFTTVPDDNHNEVVVNVTIIINQVPSTVEVEDASALYGNPLIVPVTFTNAIGVNASVVDYPDANITYTSDGIIINGLAVGNYTLNVATVVDDNHAVAVDTASITVNEKPVLPLTVDVADIAYGDDLFVLISADADVGVGVKLDDAAESVFNFVQIVNGSGNFTFSDVNSGLHTVIVMFIGNEDYAETVVSKNVTVNKAPSTVTVEDASALYGQSVIVPVSFTGAEFINASVVGYPDANIICTSDGIVISGLAVGNYTLKVVTIPDENHEAAEATANIAVNRAIVTKENFNDYFTEDGTLRQDLPELVFVGNFEAKNINIDKPVTLIGENAKLKDVQFNVLSDNVAIINMDVNNNNVNPVIAADGVSNFTLVNNVIVLDTVSDKVAVVLVNNSDKVTIRDNFITASGKNFVDGILISDSNFTISTNVITVSTSNTAEGIHIMGSSNGDVTDNDVDVRANVTVFGMNTTVINPAFRCNITFSFNVIYGEAVYAVGINDDSETIDNNKVTLKANQAVGVIVNSENAQVTENTIKLIAAESQAGQDNDAVGVQVNAKSVISSNDIDSFGKSISVDNGDGTLVSNNNANAAMSISATSTKIIGNEITTVDEKAVYVLDTATGTVIDDNVLTANGVNGNDAVSNAGTGTEVKNNKAKPQLAINPIADVFEGQGVVIVITADKNFTGDVKLHLGNANSTVSIINGSGKVNVAGDKLAVGEVIVKVIFDGNDKYTNDTVNTTFTVKAKVVTAIQATAVTTTYGTSKNIVVTLKDANGNVLADKKVTVVLNGAKKELTTNAKGQASYAVGTKLAVKTHTATITFDGDTEYAKSTGTVNVVVKKATPKLTAKKKTFKVKKAKKYTIVLKTDKGKALSKAKVTLTGKFKGKKIKVTVKTNSKGKATFNLKKLTKKGKFTATVKFAGNKNYKSVTKKAKITVKK